VSVYAGTRGFLDKIPTAKVGRFETELLSHMHAQHQDVLDTIRTKKDVGPVEDKLKSVLAAFAENFA